MAEGGISSAQLQSAISNLESRLRGEIRDVDRKVEKLRSWVESEIDRLEREMREIGDKIVGAINQQTAAIVGGVAANTVMLETLKGKVEDEFGRTIDKLDSQIESALQVEVVKKMADASSIRSKLSAFVSDIRTRFDKSIFNAAANRELYNLNFRKITDEYENKIYTIGQHIFEVRDQDIAPLLQSAKVPYELTHGLSIEMDIARLSARSQNLDETVGLLQQSRVDEVLSSLDDLENELAEFSLPCEPPAADIELCVEAIVTHSPTASSLHAGMKAQQVSEGRGIHLIHEADLGVYSSAEGRQRVVAELEKADLRTANEDERAAIAAAAADLAERKLISAEARDQLVDFLGAGKLKVLGA
jgi:hypothetical protein